MVYGIPASNDPSPSTRVEHDISKLSMYFSKILTEDESVSVCKAYRVGPVGTNGDNRPRALKVILSSEQDLKLLLSRKRKLVSFAPNIFSQELLTTRALEVSGAELRNSAQVKSRRDESYHPGRQDYITPHHTEIISMAGASKAIRLPKPVAYKKLLVAHTNACSLVTKLGEVNILINTFL